MFILEIQSTHSLSIFCCNVSLFGVYKYMYCIFMLIYIYLYLCIFICNIYIYIYVRFRVYTNIYKSDVDGVSKLVSLQPYWEK